MKSYVRLELTAVLALKADAVILNGQGGAEPLGIKITSSCFTPVV